MGGSIEVTQHRQECLCHRNVAGTILNVKTAAAPGTRMKEEVAVARICDAFASAVGPGVISITER